MNVQMLSYDLNTLTIISDLNRFATFFCFRFVVNTSTVYVQERLLCERHKYCLKLGVYARFSGQVSHVTLCQHTNYDQQKFDIIACAFITSNVSCHDLRLVKHSRVDGSHE